MYSVTEFRRRIFVLSAKVLPPYSNKYVKVSLSLDEKFELIFPIILVAYLAFVGKKHFIFLHCLSCCLQTGELIKAIHFVAL